MTTTSPDRTPLSSLNAVAGARQTAQAFLEALEHPAIAPDCADSVVLVVSELVTNALRHGGGTYTLRRTAHPGSIEVAVDDPSAEPPRMRIPDLRGGIGGFGWHMVNDLALATVITPRPEGGKTVLAPLPR
ncbi:ATP-binding protein [Streptomyces sp. NBC_01264]|uniref:ATP-binding protein n=1 Tax=Streptomyces sp. NBC_01264 TaxID=2903804 RepID=UPI00225B4C3A|nr:ATP-binding protein [Streptomyces sp. NBC_01264]MCX4775411.1 ATP-binding protein [Streptomyces sp. NBC_01264]